MSYNWEIQKQQQFACNWNEKNKWKYLPVVKTKPGWASWRQDHPPRTTIIEPHCFRSRLSVSHSNIWRRRRLKGHATFNSTTNVEEKMEEIYWNLPASLCDVQKQHLVEDSLRLCSYPIWWCDQNPVFPIYHRWDCQQSSCGGQLAASDELLLQPHPALKLRTAANCASLRRDTNAAQQTTQHAFTQWVLMGSKVNYVTPPPFHTIAALAQHHLTIVKWDSHSNVIDLVTQVRVTNNLPHRQTLSLK